LFAILTPSLCHPAGWYIGLGETLSRERKNNWRTGGDTNAFEGVLVRPGIGNVRPVLVRDHGASGKADSWT
jgi:hypothetical protein